MGPIKKLFTIDGETSYEGFTLGNLWNGFECPYFTFETASKIMNDLKGKDCGQDDDTCEYDEKTDTFNIWGDEYLGMLLRINNENVKVYPIGAYGWTWTKAE